MKSTFFFVALTVIVFFVVPLQAKDFPYVARICKDSASLRCSGIIITRRLVLTSAYCVFNTTQVRVYVGTTEDLCSKKNIHDKRTLTTSIFFKEPHFKSESTSYPIFSNDLAVILLPVILDETDTIKVATLSTEPIKDFTEIDTYVSGWGPKTQLQYNTTRIMNNKECADIFSTAFKKTYGCARVNDKRKMYFVDPGSPVEYKGKIVGYKTNDYLNSPDTFIFVDIHNYSPFIRELQKTYNSAVPLQNSLILSAFAQVVSLLIFKLTTF